MANDEEKLHLADMFNVSNENQATCFKSYLECMGLGLYIDQKLTLQDACSFKSHHGSVTYDPDKVFHIILEGIMMSNYQFRKPIFLTPCVQQEYNIDSNGQNGSHGRNKESVISKYSSGDFSCGDINAFHPMDSIFALLNCADNFLQQELYCKLSSCQFAVPLLLPDPFSQSVVFPLFSLYGIIKQWRCPVPGSDRQGNFKMYNARVVDCEIPLISFIRFSRPEKFSKSKVLNSVMDNFRHDFFFNHECEGSSINRRFIDGLVEVCWYLPAGRKTDSFGNAVTIANLRGNASKHIKQLKFLIFHSEMVFAFLSEEDIKMKRNESFSLFDSCKNVTFFLQNCTPKGMQVLKKLVPRGEIMIMEEEPAANVKCIRQKINNKINEPHSNYCRLSCTLNSCQELSIQIDTNNSSCKRGALLAQAIMEKFKSIPGREIHEKFALIHEPHFQHCQTTQFSEKPDSYPVVKDFLNSITGETLEVRKYFLHWLKYHFENFSYEHTHDLVQRKCQFMLDKLHCKNFSEAEELEPNYHKQTQDIMNPAFGLEHLIRALAYLYESTVASTESKDEANKVMNPLIKKLPRAFAELLQSHHPLELFNANTMHIPKVWISAIIDELKTIIGASKIFVLSVLGYSGISKSTLLHTLFGVNFDVTALHCTRGTYIHLIKNCEEPSTELNCSFVLLIHTEGLSVPRICEQTTKQNDNQIAVFLAGLARLTIINISGDETIEAYEMMKIVTDSFMRLKIFDLGNPSCLFIKHCFVTSFTDSLDKKRKFINCLDKLTVMAAIAGHCEEKYRHFTDIVTFNNEDDVHNFSHVWEGDPPMAPVNPAFCVSIGNLKLKLGSIFKRLDLCISLDEFKNQIAVLWDRIEKKIFFTDFKTSHHEVEACNYLDAQLSHSFWKLQNIVSEWENTTRTLIASGDNRDLEKVKNQQVNSIHQQVNEKSDEIVKDFKLFVKETTTMFHSKVNLWEDYYVKTLDNTRTYHQTKAERFCENAIKDKHSRSLHAYHENPSFIHFLEMLGHAAFFPQKLTLQDALLIRQNKSDRYNGTFDPHQLFYLMIEKIMMSNYECRKVFLFAQCTKDDEQEQNEEDDDEELEVSFKKIVHPMDGLFALIHCSDDFLRQELYSKLSSSKLAVPMLLPDPTSDSVVFTSWAMLSIVKSWKSKLENLEGKITFKSFDGRIIDHALPMISFIRFSRPDGCSKSKILNNVISDLKHDSFFNFECEGSSVNRLFVDGVVETCWYFPTGEKSDIFPDAITFANLRGNVNKHIKQLSFLTHCSEIFFIFLTVHDISSENLKKFTTCRKVVFIFHTCSSEMKSVVKELVPNSEILILKKEPAAVVSSIRSKINKKLAEPTLHRCQLSKSVVVCNELSIKVDLDSDSCKQGKSFAEAIIEKVKHVPAAEVKEKMVPLQGPKLWHEWAKLDKKQNRKKWVDTASAGFEKFNAEMRAEKEKVRKQQVKKARNLSDVIKLFLNVLLKESPQVRAYFLQWLKFYFDDYSHKELPDLQMKCQNTRDAMRAKDKTEQELKNLREVLRLQAKKLVNASFGVEHLFRELAQLYESTCTATEIGIPQEVLADFKKLPKLAAELLLSGHPLEIIDGDAAHIPQKWVSAVLNELKILTNTSKIFILSVLGIQSTGKSTLLNTLFGVRFAVSAGRCTRGAYFQLLKLDENLCCNSGCNFVLVIDTEGLRAPELSDQDTQQHDNELAALVIGLAGVTIINIFGEVPADIDDILQTTVHAFIRMTNVELKPSCQFVRHHVANVSASKTDEGRQQFLDKLDGMTVMAAKAERCEGQYTRFSDVISFTDDTDVHNFPNLWEGNPPMAPVNPSYCEAALKLKSRFLSDLSESSDFQCSVDEFDKRIMKLWKAILQENFVFSFKNTLEMEAYSCLDAEYSRYWSWELQKLVLAWQGSTRNRIMSSDNTSMDTIQQEQIETIQQQLDDNYKEVMKKIKEFFENSNSSLAPTMAKWRAEFEIKLKSMRDYHKEAAVKFCQDIIKNKKAKRKVQDLKKDQRGYITKLVKALVVSNMDIVKTMELNENNDQIKQIFNEEWNKWMEKIRKDHPLPEEQNIAREMLNCLRTKCQLNAHEQLLISKVDQVPLTQRGRKPLQMVVDEKKHLDCHVKSNKFFKALKDYFLSIQDKVKLAKEKTDMWLLETANALDQQTKNCNDFLLFISLMKELLEKIFTFESSTEVDFRFTHEYQVDLILEISGYALRVFTEVQHDVINDHPVTYMESLRPTYCTRFLTLCNKTAQEKAAAMCLTDLVVKHFDGTLQSRLQIAIVTDAKNKNPIFYSKIALKGHILLMLLEKQDFSLYLTYLRKISESYFYWGKLLIEQHCASKRLKLAEQQKGHHSESQSKVSVITDLAEIELKQIENKVKSAIDAASNSNSSDIKQWLKKFHESISETLPLNDRELDDMVNIEKDSTEEEEIHHEFDINFFASEFLKGIKKNCERYLASFQSPMKCPVLDMSKWVKHPAETIRESIAGCCEQCPFCDEQCEETMSDHPTDHHCELHRPQGLGGYRTDSSEEMVTEMCTECVGSDMAFSCQDSNNTFIPYKDYRQIYPKWFIPEQNHKIAPYWKWFAIKYKKEIAEFFGFKVNLPPDLAKDWEGIQVADARDDVKERYNIQ